MAKVKSMYDLVFGDGRQVERGSELLPYLNLSMDTVGRYRDAAISKDGDQLVVVLLTRNGGPNRACLYYTINTDEDADECQCAGCIQSIHLPMNEWYIRDEDDSTDPTYCRTYFRIPDDLQVAMADREDYYDWCILDGTEQRT